MNKRKPDDEFAQINLSYFKASGEEVVVFCPESKDAAATQQPARRRLTRSSTASPREMQAIAIQPRRHRRSQSRNYEHSSCDSPSDMLELKEQHFTILYGDTGYSYESIMGPYLRGAKAVVIEDPYIRLQHQIQNFVRFCETVSKPGP